MRKVCYICIGLGVGYWEGMLHLYWAVVGYGEGMIILR